jgi:N6-L-threonylcarbamoyladenine synthase
MGIGAPLSASGRRKRHDAGKLKLNLKRGQSFRGAAFMGIMRRAFYNRLKEKHPDAGTAYGYAAKNTRIRNGLEKDHAVGARCTGGNPKSIPLGAIYMQKAAGKRNRQIHKASINKGGKRKLNQSPKYVHGFQLFGRVQMPDRRKGFIFGRRSSGSFDVRALDGEKLSAGTGRKKLKPLEKRKTILTERGVRLPPHA